jgi:hypothetical protein
MPRMREAEEEEEVEVRSMVAIFTQYQIEREKK